MTPRRFEPIVFAILVAAWAVAWVLHVDLALRDRLSWAPLYVEPAADAGAFPRVLGFWPETRTEDTSLLVGDRLEAVGERDLRGRSHLAVLAAVYAEAGDSRVVSFTVEGDDRRRSAHLALRPYSATWIYTPLVLGLGLAALAIRIRRPDSPAGRSTAHAFLLYAIHWSAFLSGGGWRTFVGLPVEAISIACTGPLAVIAVWQLPRARRPAPERRPHWPWLFVAIGPLLLSWQVGWPLAPRFGLPLLLVGYLAIVVCLLYGLMRAYRDSDARGRRQLRWVVFGFWLALTPPAISASLVAWQPAWRPVYEASTLALLAIPLCMTIALTRFDLFDIDRLISSTASYSLLGIAFVALLLVVAPRASDAASQLTALDPALVQTLLAVALSGAFVFGGRAIRPHLERFFFSERHALDAGVHELRRRIRDFEAPGSLFERVGETLTALLGLRTCAVYARSGEAFAPLFAFGPAVPPGFAAEGRLALLLDEANRAVSIERWHRWQKAGLLEEAEAASLEGLDARLLLPIRRDKRIEAFFCFGEKGSEDVYTPVDIALLEGLADTISFQLERFDAAAIERAERDRYERLAGYVPAAVRDELTREVGDTAPGAREVSLLFVDIRGYTGFSEGRTPDEIFAVVNAYTEAVSERVRAHGGWVVDFQGDGLMAVFGAPRAMPGKERAAVETALSLAREFSLEAVTGVPLELGVGVATGPAYVGNVQSVDRRIWCVIGNTTNLAARLQSLTKDLEVQVVIDDETYRRAGDVAAGFRARPDMRIRGRSESMTLHLAS